MSITVKDVDAGVEATKIILRARTSAEPSKQPISLILAVANAVSVQIMPGDPASNSIAVKRGYLIDAIVRRVLEGK